MLVEVAAPIAGAVAMLIVGLGLTIPLITYQKLWFLPGILSTFSGFFVAKMINPEMGWISAAFLAVNAIAGGVRTGNIFYFMGSLSMTAFVLYRLFFD